MTRALQQLVFALDAHYNAHRAPGSPHFRTLYIRRRSQLLREAERNPEQWKQYIRLRSTLLQQKYGTPSIEQTSLSSSHTSNSSRDSVSVASSSGRVVPTRQAEASKALVGGNSIAENYAFAGVHHIFDQHTAPVTMVKFANNDKSTLCCSSVDATLSICNVTSQPPTMLALLRGHTKPVTGFDWSSNNDLIVSTSMDCTCRVWKVATYTCLRIVLDKAQLLCCLFQPINNNIFLTGNGKGELKIANVSTGRFMKNTCKIGGNVLSIAADTNGRIFWAGNDKGEIISVFFEMNGGLCKTKKISLGFNCSVTSLSYRAWISREARDPLLLVNSTDNSLRLFSVMDCEGTLQLKRTFQNRHKKHMVRSTFCPLISFRQGACVVTGSEDGTVYFIDVEKFSNKAVVNTLQGHAAAVLGVNFNYDESLLATCDLEGLVILWKRANIT